MRNDRQGVAMALVMGIVMVFVPLAVFFSQYGSSAISRARHGDFVAAPSTTTSLSW